MNVLLKVLHSNFHVSKLEGTLRELVTLIATTVSVTPGKKTNSVRLTSEMSVDKILQAITESADGLLGASDEPSINGLIQKGSEAYKQLTNVVEDVKFMVKATDEDQRAVLEIFQDCVTQLKDLGKCQESVGLTTTVIQAGQYAKTAHSGNKEARSQLETASKALHN